MRTQRPSSVPFRSQWVQILNSSRVGYQRFIGERSKRVEYNKRKRYYLLFTSIKIRLNSRLWTVEYRRVQNIKVIGERVRQREGVYAKIYYFSGVEID